MASCCSPAATPWPPDGEAGQCWMPSTPWPASTAVDGGGQQGHPVPPAPPWPPGCCCWLPSSAGAGAYPGHSSTKRAAMACNRATADPAHRHQQHHSAPSWPSSRPWPPGAHQWQGHSHLDQVALPVRCHTGHPQGAMASWMPLLPMHPALLWMVTASKAILKPAMASWCWPRGGGSANTVQQPVTGRMGANQR